jgi:hypothetical protein
MADPEQAVALDRVVLALTPELLVATNVIRLLLFAKAAPIALATPIVLWDKAVMVAPVHPGLAVTKLLLPLLPVILATLALQIMIPVPMIRLILVVNVG